MSEETRVRHIRAGEGVRLELPGRESNQLWSGQDGVTATVRRVVIPADTASARSFHVHHGSEEFLYVLDGHGCVRTPSSRTQVVPGDTVCIPSELPHMTVPRSGERIVLLAFFPHPDIDRITEELEGPA